MRCSETTADLVFGVIGRHVPLDHRYELFAAISTIIPSLHGTGGEGVGICPITGTKENNLKVLHQNATFRIRVPLNRAAMFTKISGKTLMLGQHQIQVGIPQFYPVIAAHTIVSNIVYIRLLERDGIRHFSPERFTESINKQLTALGVGGKTTLGPIRSMQIKQRSMLGYRVVISELDDDSSLRVQECGIGGKRTMGCGIFFGLKT